MARHAKHKQKKAQTRRNEQPKGITCPGDKADTKHTPRQDKPTAPKQKQPQHNHNKTPPATTNNKSSGYDKQVIFPFFSQSPKRNKFMRKF